MIGYNKLVRDKIPQMIAENGETPIIRVLSNEEYRTCLGDKLDEEVREYRESGELEELADILEVVCALASAGGFTEEQLYAVRHEKRVKCGSFTDKILLIGKE